MPLRAASSFSGAMGEPSKKEELKEELEEKIRVDTPRDLIWNAFLEALPLQKIILPVDYNRWFGSLAGDKAQECGSVAERAIPQQ